MQFTLSLASALAVLQFAAAEVVYVTQFHTTTVDYGYQAPASTQAAAPAAPAQQQAQVKAADPVSSPVATTLSTAASPSPSSTGSSNSGGIYADIALSPDLDQKFAKDTLDAHNADRAKHSAPELSWDKTVYEYAQAYADKYDCSGSLTHSGGKYGENLAAGYSDGPAAVEAWYNEGNEWNYQSTTDYNHFSQVVWKSTTKLGCAIKDCRANNWGYYVICSYDPAGNFMGEQPENVLPN